MQTTIEPKNSPTEANDATGGDLLDRLVGHFWTAPDGTEWECERRFKTHVRARKVSSPGYGEKAKISRAEGWRKHELPKTLKKGAVLMHHGEPVKVTSFANLGGQIMVGLTGRWGSDEGHTHENLLPLYSGLINDGYRLPFEGEDISSPNV